MGIHVRFNLFLMKFNSLLTRDVTSTFIVFANFGFIRCETNYSLHSLLIFYEALVMIHVRWFSQSYGR